MTRQYIGVSGVSTAAQVALLHDVWKANQWGKAGPVVRAACYMSYQSLNSVPHDWLYDYPDKTKIEKLFRNPTDRDWPFDDSRHIRLQKIFRSLAAQTCVHYIDPTNTDVTRSVGRAIAYGGSGLQALHLDMIWPSPHLLQLAFEAVGKQPLVTLRVGREAMAARGDDVATIVEYLSGYEGLISHVSLDRSLGTDELVPYIEGIRARFPQLGIELAGGLGVKTVHLVNNLLQQYPFLSVMAGTNLHLRGDRLLPIRWDEAAEYLRLMLRQVYDAQYQQR